MTELFNMGRCCITPGAKAEIDELDYLPATLLNRHHQGDWGDLEPEDIVANNRALIFGDRLFSAYILQGVKFWVITEADRSSTTIMLPSEY
jgi:hypothetical protein